jgi:membrane associated rhomboid family serine protease
VRGARRRDSLTEGFTFGGRVPGAVGLVIVLLGLGTLVGWITGLGPVAALVPDLILRGQLWRLVTWAFVQGRGDFLGLLFAGLVIWSMGSQLAYAWGERQFLARFLLIAVGASAGATLLALIWEPANQPHLGVWPVANALLLAWAMLYPTQQVSIWGVLPLTGKTLGLLVVFGTALYGLAAGGIPGLGSVAPHFAALATAWALSRGRLPTRRWKLQLREWWSERQFRRRTKHLRVVKKNGHDGPPRWMN